MRRVAEVAGQKIVECEALTRLFNASAAVRERPHG
jgi:hypothetical protein